MRAETIAIHGGYQIDPATKSVAVPIYQTVAYGFDSAEHGASLFNLEVEGFRYSRISNPTTVVLETTSRRLEGRRGSALRQFRPGRDLLCGIESYGTRYQFCFSAAAVWNHLHPFRTLFADPGLQVRFASRDPWPTWKLIDTTTGAITAKVSATLPATSPTLQACRLGAQARDTADR